MNKLTKIARNEVCLSELMVNRTKIDTDDIIADYKEGISVCEIDVLTIDNSTYAIGAFKEDITKFFNGGKVFFNIVMSWIKAMGSIEAVNEELAKNAVKLIFKMGKTKKGNNVTLIEVVE